MGASVCWGIHMFEYSAKELYNQFKKFLFLIVIGCFWT